MRETAAMDPVAFVIIGATGDLSQRLLLPALYRLFTEGALSRSLAVVGMSRRAMTDDQFRAFARDGVAATGAPPDAERWQEFAERLVFVSADSTREADYARLARTLAAVEERFQTGGNRLFYIAAPPSTYEAILAHLGHSELVRYGSRRPWTRVVIEKPFGADEASARRLNALVDRFIGEEAVFRIDHYLGKETVQNMLVFRFANTIFEPVWNRRYVDHVQISFVEEIGVGGRGRFYEEVGVVRDVVQNHVLQLLAIIAMEPPVAFDADGFRNEKAKVFRAIPPVRPEHAVRGQYGRGMIRGRPVPAYREEEGVDPASTTPTYAAMRLQIDNWRWADVPFYLRAGKRLNRKDTEVVVVFRQPPLRLFRDYDMAEMDNNVLVLHTAEDERITLRFAARVPGHRQQIRSVQLRFSYREFGEAEHPAYEHLILDALRGVQTLFPRRDEVELQWAIVDPLLRHWAEHPPQDFPNYPAGSTGPAEADALLAREGRVWRTG
ncbi:MAG: glucose-6-phosphate dehydrogenase [Armatimonadota bacterium]|nr:glucose-6-phosphate dehydrogenase [Armatimonadota bacterium]MDR7437826.1 glucose-6-phosphate dehydrogenase [Armatimonadota bacterium]MDR7473151.1 glucose-6-phosphate dehydrogenase [Armatimonadota bacterium]MDR7507627.1 glucose-6-phosphate dehydrogenase [Armatimonadota bacterium]MDR7509953.1 glucose-6-phosphate dehydrogenase [Armatimonadota bacterium]